MFKEGREGGDRARERERDEGREERKEREELGERNKDIVSSCLLFSSFVQMISGAMTTML